MTITSQLAKKEFIKAALVFVFRKIHIRIIYGFILALIVLNVIIKIQNPEVKSSIFPLLIGALGMPLFLSLTYGKMYNQNPDLQGPIHLRFENEKMISEGTTSKSEIQINAIYRIFRMNGWYFLQTHKQQFLPIKVAGLTEEQLLFLEQLKAQTRKK